MAIEQLREQFDKMTTAQKKAFIERLRTQSKGKVTPFLIECVNKYNAEARGGSPMPMTQGTAAISQPKKSPLIGIIVCLIVVAVVGGGVFAYLALSNSASGIFNNSVLEKDKIVGTWVLNDGIYETVYIFYSGDTYAFSVRDIGRLTPKTIDEQAGMYEISEKTITFSPMTPSNKKQWSIYFVKFEDNNTLVLDQPMKEVEERYTTFKKR